MSEFVGKAVEMLNEKMGGGGFDGVARIVLKDEGSLILDKSGARISDDAADVTLTASVDTFRGILDGDTNPTAAFMTGKLTVDGDMGLALKLASVLG
jgi:putative sterol carrier protein